MLNVDATPKCELQGLMNWRRVKAELATPETKEGGTPKGVKSSGHAARPVTQDSHRTREQLIARTLGLKAAWLDRRSLSCTVLACAMADLRAIQIEALTPP